MSVTERLLGNPVKRTTSKIAIALLYNLLCWLPCCLTSQGYAQTVSELPTQRYYAARDVFRQGNVVDAAEGFDKVLSLAQQSSTDGWIDSVPTRVMLAECHYHQGELAKALELYDSALMIVLKYPGWLDQFNLGDHVLPAHEGNAKGINWFKLSHPTVSLALPSSVQLNADLMQSRAAGQGNIAPPLNALTRLDSAEVLRTIGIALTRRWQLLGPLARHSPLTNPLVQYFSNDLKQNQVWARASWATLRGLAILSQDADVAAQQLAAVVYLDNRQFDFFLTPLSLQVQGEIQANKGQYQAAIVHFQDASLLAAQYLQLDQLSETFLWLGDCASANQRIDLLEPLLVAGAWGNKKSSFVQVAVLSSASELAVLADRIPQARKLITQEANILKSSKGSLPRYQSRLIYNEAIVAFRENQGAVGWTRIKEAVALMRGSAQSGPIPPQVYQSQLTLDLLFSGNLTHQDGERVLAQILAEPDKASWELRPLETLAALTTAALPAYKRWLSLVDLSDKQKLLERFDLVQQRQVFEAMPLGGRAYSWKRALTTPLVDLPPDVRPVVASTIQTVPALDQLPTQLEEAVKKARQLPYPLDERQIKNDQKQIYTAMDELAERFENQLMIQVLSRKSLRRFIPASFTLPSAQRSLAEGDVLLGMIEVGDQLACVAVSKDRVETWLVPDAASIAVKLNLLYRQIGLTKNQGAKLTHRITDPAAEWRMTAADLYKTLLQPNAEVGSMIQSARRLIVAPSGTLWYVPFELLIGGNRSALISSTAITYIPTLGSLEFAYLPTAPVEHSLILLSNFFSNDKAINSKEAAKVADAVDNSKVAQADLKSLPSSQWLRVRTDELILLAEVNSKPDDTNLRVMPFDNLARSRLGEWVGSMLKNPQTTWLPGVNTTLQSGEPGNGNDIFLPVSALLYSGSRGVISRWSVAGDSTTRYLERARQESVRSKSLSTALRRTTVALWAEQFSTSAEPILSRASHDNELLTSGEHPLFWAGYMAVGDGRP